MKVYENILDTIGRTPLVRLHRIVQGTQGLSLVKAESFNPGGSVKDRIGVHMVDEAERNGKLRPGGTIVENTSGNTGLGLALVAAVRGYKAIFTMPDKVAPEKSALLRSFGAEVILCPTAVEPDDPRSYYSVARRLATEIENAFCPNQYDNAMNPDAHYRTTGPEIWEDTGGKVTHFVAGMGTGGTITGIGKYLKEQNPDVKVIGVDPIGSLYAEYFRTGEIGEAHTYKIEGVGEDIIPSTIDFDYIDEVVQVTDRDAFRIARRLAREDAIFTGSSGGMAMWAGMQVAQRLGPNDVMVVLIPDTGERYLSKVYNEDWLRENQLIDPGITYTAREIIARKQKPFDVIISVAPEMSARDAIALMRQHDISQLPVIEGADHVVGGLREAGVIELLLQGESATDRPVREVMDKPFPIIEESAAAEEIYDLISHGAPAVLVKTAGGYSAITKWDLIHSISGKR
ncbi:MAG: pyridoxal-phosphate dependent enzyme [Planctomycetes bacterium]|nr:pyridoxal-phosphate dependent enzyme [Planctomycetota bacterium]